MKKNRELFEDLNKLTGSALSGVIGIKNEIAKSITAQMQAWVKSMNFVSYEEFHALKKLASKTKMELEALKAHLGLAETTKPSKAKTKQEPKKKTKSKKEQISN
jgi:BMFP domain-containing protein YqiC